MEYDWERTFPFLKINRNQVIMLFQGILKKENIIRVTPINEYNKNSHYKLEKDWYEVCKLRDLINLIQLIDGEENMPNKYANIKNIIINNIKILE